MPLPEMMQAAVISAGTTSQQQTVVATLAEDGRLRLANEAALGLLGEMGEGERSLAMISSSLRGEPWQKSTGKPLPASTTS